MNTIKENTGVNDTLEDIQKTISEGYSINEILAQSSNFIWKKTKDVTYKVWNQSGTSACVAFAKAKQVSIRIFLKTGVWIDFSPAFIYNLRRTKGEGMNIADANDIVNNVGVTLEALMKSQNLTEEQIAKVKSSKVADLFAKAIAEAVVSYLYIPNNIDRIAQTIHSGKAVSLLIYANVNEYARRRPVIIDSSLTYNAAPIRHEVVAVDYYIDGKEKIIRIDDSSHFGGFSEREFTEEFINKRCILADAIDIFEFEEGVGQKPVYDGSIISLQQCLRYEGLFPLDVDYVENYGPITMKGVRAFQVKHGLHPTGVDNVGPKTVAKLKELYN